MNYKSAQKKLISQGCCTYSKRYDQYAYNHPTHVVESSGARVLGSDGKWYIDTIGGLGSSVIDIRNNYCKPSIYEPMLAQEIVKRIKFIEKVKFLKTGSAACEAAVRIARAHTGRNVVFGTGYHGCSNVFIASENPGSGCVKEGYVKHKDLATLIDEILYHKEFNAVVDIAAVIVEPVQLKCDGENTIYLKDIRKLCTDLGIILIFDEIITGFRTPNYCMSQYLGIIPDLITFGKAMANGYPLAVVGGSKELMDTEGIFISNTHNGEESSIKAAIDTINTLNKATIKNLWEKGTWFRKELSKIIPEDMDLRLAGYATRGEWQSTNPEIWTIFCEQMADRGILIGRGWFITLAHDTKTLNSILKAAKESVVAIQAGAKLRGYVPQPIFKRN